MGSRALLAAELDPTGDRVSADVCTAQRPAVEFNRWKEDWSKLANPCVEHRPFDGLKYIPLNDDPTYYLSLGANLRERLETNNTTSFGIGSARPDTYVIQRAELHADLRLGNQVQVFTQLFDASAFQKNTITPVDKNPLDVEQAFVVVTENVDDNTIKWRVGRQEMAFDLQRFVSVRDGPNIRQAFDAVWTDWERGDWRFIGFASQPVQYRDTREFDDISNRHLRFNGLRFERRHFGPGTLSAFYAQYDRDNAVFVEAKGAERRNAFDLHYDGKLSGYDWDVEVMDQTGQVGAKSISAWSLGSVAGYSFMDEAWRPRVGLQFDVATGNRHADGSQLGTFNPLFPNGYYFTLAGYSGDTNIIHLKPSITLNPTGALSVFAALGLQWRETNADAVYGQGLIAVPNTAGHGDRWTGAYAQLRVDDKLTDNLTGAVEAVHFQVGESIRQAGGKDANYLGVELKFCW